VDRNDEETKLKITPELSSDGFGKGNELILGKWNAHPKLGRVPITDEHSAMPSLFRKKAQAGRRQGKKKTGFEQPCGQ